MPRYGIPVRVKMIPVYRKGNNSFIPKMAARAAGPGDEFTIVKNEKGKADIWKYFGLKKAQG